MSLRPSLEPGAVFARDFKIVGPLAEGGMGAVYVVEQLSTGKQRALKVMHEQAAQDPRSRERFTQEAQVSSRIESDHVVEVMAAGVDAATNTPWLAMELLKGRTLEAHLAEHGHLAPAEVLEILRQACHALGQAHRAGVVHRDLKPDNLFLADARRMGVPFTVKILDFGIAKWAQDARANGLNSQLIGTPLWMAPEQLQTGQPITPSTDLWALGLIAFRLLTGKHFWLSANESSTRLPGLVAEVALYTVPPSSQRAAELGVAERIPPGFDAWFARCVQRDAALRFPAAVDAIAALQPVLAPPTAGSFPEPTTANFPAAGGAPRSVPTPVGPIQAAVLPATGRTPSGGSPAAPPPAAIAGAGTAGRPGPEVFFHALVRDITDAGAYAGLFEHFAAQGALERQWAVCAAMTFVMRERAGTEVWAFYARHRPAGLAVPSARLDDARAMADLAHPDQDPLASRVLALALPALLPHRCRPLGDFGIPAGELHAPRTSAVPLARAVGVACAALGVTSPPLVYLRPDLPVALDYLGSHPWVTVAGRALMSQASPHEMMFAAGRHAARYRPEHHARVLFPVAADLGALVGALVELADPGGARGPALELRAVHAALAQDPPRWEALRAASRALRARGTPFDPGLWLRAVEFSACRAGYLLSGDLYAAQAILQSDAPGALDEPPLIDRLKDLVLFSLSDAYYRLRDAIGMRYR